MCTNNTGDNCDTNAFCTNTTGNFTCTCNRGYTGNGVICTGKLFFTSVEAYGAKFKYILHSVKIKLSTLVYHYFTGPSILSMYLLLDNNECTDNTDNCDTNANCTNTPGSFTCTCNSGYTRNGVTCIGMYYSYLKDFVFNCINLRH